MRESDIEKYLVKRVKELGGEVRKVKWVGRQGAPDRLVMLPFRSERIAAALAHFNLPTDHLGARAIWIELKAPSKAATFPANAHERKQHREHERLRKMGQQVIVVDSFARIDELLG